MLIMICAGRMKGNARIVGQQTRALVGTIETKEEGFGKASGKIFSKYVKFSMFGKNIEALAPKLTDGALVHAQGKPDIESFKGRDGTEKHSLKLTGFVALSLEGVMPEAPPDDGQYGSGAPAPSDDVPY